MDQQDLERITRDTLRELGVTASAVSVVPAGDPGVWRVEFDGRALRITCGRGSTAQWVRQQLFDQLLSR